LFQKAELLQLRLPQKRLREPLLFLHLSCNKIKH
jgi:hypothetical protein